MVTGDDRDSSDPILSVAQAYESAYRFVAQYSERERIVPLLLMLVAMRPEDDISVTNDPASWEDWQRCVRQTLAGEAMPDLSPPHL
ncbi:MAG: hypothetical protein QOC79_257 [Actinomycetota bacterium]|nr:hypothetical protein [Actinomycetota bacterium]